MYILTDKSSVAFCSTETLNYQSNGNPLVYGDTLAISKTLVKNIYNTTDAPDDYEDGKYIFDGSEWSRNPEGEQPPAQALTYDDLAERLAATEEALRGLGVEI